MKNKNIKSIALILCLGLAAYLLNNKENSITRTDRRDFTIADTSEVIKVILTSKAPETAILERVNEGLWTINENYKARKSGIFYLLKTLQRMEIAHPVPLSMRDNVLGNLAVKGIKVQVFLKNGEEKTLYVGGENQELTATFMMLQGATDPYAVHIPGFRGYLSSRFFTREYLWRDKTVMNYDNRAIASIRMQYHDINKKSESFQIEYENESYRLSAFNSETAIEADPKKMDSYIASFRKLYAESFVSGTLNTDSLRQTKPIFDLTVKTKDEQETHIKVFHKKAAEGTYVDGDITMRDPERMYALVNGEDWMVIQLNTFKKVMKKLSELKK
jgi:hypothetical protein